MSGQTTLFVNTEASLGRLSHMGDPLERLRKLVDWDGFREPLLDVLRDTERKASSGRKRFDVVLMFRIIVIKHFYALSDDSLHYLIRDRLSFMRFIGVEAGDALPSRTTINQFRGRLKKTGVLDELLQKVENQMYDQQWRVKPGRLLDVCFIRVAKAMHHPRDTATC